MLSIDDKKNILNEGRLFVKEYFYTIALLLLLKYVFHLVTCDYIKTL